MQLDKKKVLVTGSSRGIGKAIALQLAKQGAEVIVHYASNRSEGEEVLAEIKGYGATGHLLQADLFDPANAIALGEQAWDCCGGIDFLVNNAGVSYKKHFLDQTIEDIDYFTNINFKSTLLLTQVIARKMVQHHTGGSIYTITSINGIQPGVGLSVYGATKGALETLMKGVALELAPHNILVNTVAVGAVETDMNAAMRADPGKLSIANDSIPLKRMAQPEEIARVVV
ncbi:MAG: SDR family oxidoreductase, partial [Chitinophagaceae bacterium]|nr:SDR family oxidoreductase [Chitinophagaceae bacterium]